MRWGFVASKLIESLSQFYKLETLKREKFREGRQTFVRKAKELHR